MKENKELIDKAIAEIIYLEGKDILFSKNMQKEKECIQHGCTTVYEHSLLVCYLAVKIAFKLKLVVSYRELIRGCLLHDYFLYDWHIKDKSRKKHGFYHPYVALKNASRDFNLTKKEKDIIVKHMFPLTPFPPKYKESFILCIADKMSALNETIFRKKKDSKFYNKGLLINCLSLETI